VWPLRRLDRLLQGRKGYVVYNTLGIHEYATAAETTITSGTHRVRMEFAYDGGGPAKGGDVTVYHDGKAVGSGSRTPIR
jgi:arylsulfatase